MAKFKVGDEVAVAAIMKIAAIQPQSNGTVSYSTDRGITIPEQLMEQIALTPRKPKAEEPKPAPQPAHRFKVGDRVVHKEYGLGTIIGYLDLVPSVPYLVEPDNGNCFINHWAEAAVSPAPAPEPPKFYTGKVVMTACQFQDREPHIGRLFEFKDGKYVGEEVLGFLFFAEPYKSFNDIAKNHSTSTWIEVKE